MACGSKFLKDFVAQLATMDEVKDLRHEIEVFSRRFPMPGMFASYSSFYAMGSN